MAYSDSSSASNDKKTSTMRKHILNRLLLFRPGLSKNLKYCAVSHDQADPIWDSTFFHLTGNVPVPNNKKLSVLFCGFGDARNFFASIIGSVLFTCMQPSPELHYTLLDIKAPSLARLMLLLELAEEAGKESWQRGCGRRTMAAKVIITTMAYVYSGHIYPTWAYDRVQNALGNLIANMEKNDEPIFKWLYVPKFSRGPILDILRDWKGPAKDCHTMATIRKTAVRHRMRARMRHMAKGRREYSRQLQA